LHGKNIKKNLKKAFSASLQIPPLGISHQLKIITVNKHAKITYITTAPTQIRSLPVLHT